MAPATTSSIGKFRFGLEALGSRLKVKPPASSLQPPASYGMTLVELLVVLGIIGLIVGMGLPGFTRYAQHVRLQAAVRQIVGLVSLARSTAIGSHADHAVTIDVEHRELRIVDVASKEALERTVRLPSSVTIEVLIGNEPATTPQIVFRPSGSIGGRSVSIVLADRSSQQTITVSGVTGAVSVQ